MTMLLKSWLNRTVALVVAWILFLAVAAVVGAFFGRPLWLLLVFWLWVGLILLLLQPHRFPLPKDGFVDVVGALAMLWWAAKWPAHLLKK